MKEKQKGYSSDVEVEGSQWTYTVELQYTHNPQHMYSCSQRGGIQGMLALFDLNLTSHPYLWFHLCNHPLWLQPLRIGQYIWNGNHMLQRLRLMNMSSNWEGLSELQKLAKQDSQPTVLKKVFIMSNSFASSMWKTWTYRTPSHVQGLLVAEKYCFQCIALQIARIQV